MLMGMLHKNSLPLLTAFLFLLLLPFTGSSQASTFKIDNLDSTVDISGAWRFQVGDDLAWADPKFSDSAWGSLIVPRDWRNQGYGDYSGFAWHRINLQFDISNPELRPQLGRLGIRIGKVRSAYQIFAGGQLIGSVGGLPPNQEIVYDRKANYPIPYTAIDENGRVVIAMRIWREELVCECAEGGLFEGEFLVGTINDLQRSTGFKELSALVLGMLYLMFGAYHLYLYWRNRGMRQFFWFGWLTISIGIYVIAVSQWKHYIDLPFLLLKKVEYVVLYITPILGASMIWCMLHFKPPLWARLYQWVFVVLTALIILIPNHTVNYLTLDLWQLLAVPMMVGLIVQLMWFALDGNKEARTTLVGMAIFVATALNDIMVAQGVFDHARVVPYGFAALIVAMAVSLANHFTALYTNLEAEVGDRTRELSEANERLFEASRIDVLTGLLNRRGFAERAEEEILRARRTRRGFVLVMADIDKFKAVNDEYGHACGDEVLKDVARQLERQMRDIDVLASWGGEEFVLLLPETGIDGGVILAEKLRGLIERHQFYSKEHLLNITMTFGVSSYKLAMTLDDCLAKADRALYAGKSGGRNRVEVEVDEDPEVDKGAASGSGSGQNTEPTSGAAWRGSNRFDT
jgi:diguanylate cyclase (GGDEF)-like protein